MPALTVQELKKALQRAGFEVYRTRGDDVQLAERPRANLIMDAGITVAAGDQLRVRFIVRAQRADFQGEDDSRLFDRARVVAAPGLTRGYLEVGTSVRSMLDPGDPQHVLDTWFEVVFERSAATLEEAIEEVRFALTIEKAASRLVGRRGGWLTAARRSCYAARPSMEAFRSQGMKALYGVIITAIGVVFLIQFRPGAGSQQSSGPKDTCAAEVRGECISVRDFRTSFGLIGGRRDEQFFKQTQLRRRVMDGLVERALLAQDAERLGVGISDDDLNDAMTHGDALVSVSVDAYPILPYLQLAWDRPLRRFEVKGTNGKFDKKTYDRALKQYVGRSDVEFREMQQREHLAARMRDLVRSRVRVSEAELESAYARANAKASIKYVKLSRPWFGRAINLSNAAVDAFGAEHKAELDASWESAKKQFLPECRKASHILVKADHTATDDERAAARKKVEDARERAKKGDSFAALAREISEDSSAADGGSLGCFQKGRMVKPFEDAVFSMKPGDLSPIVETEYGFHVILLESVLKDADAETEGRRQITRDRMRAVESDAKAAEAAKQVQAAITSGKSLEDAVAAMIAAYEPKPAKKKKSDDEKKDDKKHDDAKVAKPDPDRPRVEEAKDFTSEGTPIPGVTTPDVAALAFALAKPGDTPPDVLKLDGAYAVIQLVEKKAASKDGYAKERDRIVRELLSAKQQDALYAYVTRLRDAAKAEIKVNQAYITDPKAGEGEEEKE